MREYAVDTIKTLPPAAVGMLTFAGLTIEHWIQVLTVLWLVILIVGKVRDAVVWYRHDPTRPLWERLTRE